MDPHGLDEIIWRDIALDGGVSTSIFSFSSTSDRCHAAQQFHGRGDIQQMRHIADCHRVSEAVSRQNRQAAFLAPKRATRH